MLILVAIISSCNYFFSVFTFVIILGIASVQHMLFLGSIHSLLLMLVNKGSFYIAHIRSVGPLKRFTLFAFPGRPVHSDTNSASPRSILAMQQLRATTKSLTCPSLSIARYSFIQLSELGRQWRERKCPIFETVAKGDSNPGSIGCGSGILPLSYRAPPNRQSQSSIRQFIMQ